MVITAIRSQLVSVIKSNCSCDFSSSYISVESLNCIRAMPTEVVYRANITGYNDIYTSSYFIKVIEDYILTNPRVTSNSLSFTFDSSCVTQFQQGDEVCGDTLPTDTATVEGDAILIYVIIAAVIGVVLAFVLFLFVLICVITKYRKNKKIM